MQLTLLDRGSICAPARHVVVALTVGSIKQYVWFKVNCALHRIVASGQVVKVVVFVNRVQMKNPLLFADRRHRRRRRVGIVDPGLEVGIGDNFTLVRYRLYVVFIVMARFKESPLERKDTIRV